MNGFLQGIALRGAGLYPAAAVRQSPVTQPHDGLTEIATEIDVTSDGRATRETTSPDGRLTVATTSVDGRHEPRHAVEPPRLEIVEMREASEPIKRGEIEPVARVEQPRSHAEHEPSTPKPRQEITTRAVESAQMRHVEATGPARTEILHVAVAQQRDVTPVVERPVTRLDEKQDEPGVARVVLRPADAKPMILMASSPAQQSAVTAPAPEPRPVEVRIGSIEVRATAPQKPQPPARAAAPAETGFGAYVRMRTYRSHSR